MINTGAGPSNDPYEISSNTQFHQRLDQLMESNPQQHLNEILEVLGKGILYISEQDAQSYLPTIKSKLIQEQVNSNDPVIAKINEICTTLEKGKTIRDLPQDVLMSFLKQWDKKTQNTFGRTALDFQQLRQDPQILASILESEKYTIDDHDRGIIIEQPRIPLEIKLEMAKKAGNLLHLLTFRYTDLLDQQLQDVLKACPNLKVLNLLYCFNLTNEGIKNLPANIKTLTLRRLQKSFMMEEAFKNLPQTLERLYLHQAWSLSDKALENLPINLKELQITEGTLLTNQGIKNLPENLRILTLFWCNGFTDEGFKNLPKNLEKLVIQGSEVPILTEEGIKNNLPKEILSSIKLRKSFY